MDRFATRARMSVPRALASEALRLRRSPLAAVHLVCACAAGAAIGAYFAFAPWDAARKFGFAPGPGAEVPGCRCGAVLRGACAPRACPLFGRACAPADPVGPCMVSAERACAAAYQYGAPTEAAAAHGG